MNIVSVYDGTPDAKTALRYGIDKIKEKGGELTVVRVSETGMFIEHDAGPQADELARMESRLSLSAAETILREAGNDVPVRLVTGQGDPEQEVLRAAKAGKADLILVTPRYKAISRKTNCPVYIIPGTILAPVDHSYALNADINIDTVSAEAKATGSSVLLLGVVPVHLYSAGEQEEVKKIREMTSAVVLRIKKKLAERKVACSEEIRSGYPDEEILKSAEDHAVSLIMLPAGGEMPSELSKAAEILRNEPDSARFPVYLMPAMEG